MAHFAKLDSRNQVIHVSVVDNKDILDEQGKESEQVGIEYLTKVHGYSKWKQTSYNGKFRMNYAALGYTYDEDMDAFVPPQPYPSWTLDTTKGYWVPPIPMPLSGGESWTWDEPTKSWIDNEHP